VVLRSGWDAAQVRNVIAQQTPRAVRRAIADAVVDNDSSSTLEQLRLNAHALWGLWVGHG
jgi:dephospho-CoA kinase